MIYVITCDLNQGFLHNYQPFFQEIESLGFWSRYMDRTWIVATDLSVDDVTNLLIQRLGESDRLLVVPLERPYSGWLPDEAWDWVKKMYEEHHQPESIE